LERKDVEDILEERNSLLTRIRYRIDSVSEREEQLRLRKEEREYHAALNKELEGRKVVNELKAELAQVESEVNGNLSHVLIALTPPPILIVQRCIEGLRMLL
jgi:hypothetical protein